jgi:maltodextrin utilization protein YvdJ
MTESFFQAFKRTQYIKQYAAFRRNQANKIVTISDELKLINDELIERKKLKETLLTNNRLTQKSLEKEKNQANEIAFELKSQEKKYKKNILAKQKESLKIDKQVDYILKFSGDEPIFTLLLTKISSIKEIVSIYEIPIKRLKSKENLIFEY